MATEIKNLIQGYKQFRQEYFEEKKQVFKDLTLHGQKPKILVVACSDSRVDPAIVTNCKPGDLFVIRNVANIIPPFEKDNGYHGTSAALEFGVCNLKIKHIIIFGHTQCGGIISLVKDNSLKVSCQKHQQNSFIAKWMELAKPAYDAALCEAPDLPTEKLSELCGQYSLINSLKNLQTFPWVSQKIASGKLSLHAWNFDLPTGTIKVYSEEQQHFTELNDYY